MSTWEVSTDTRNGTTLVTAAGLLAGPPRPGTSNTEQETILHTTYFAPPQFKPFNFLWP